MPGIDARLLPHDLSPWNMFLSADSVVKGVMIGLALASVAVWTVWLVKSIELWRARRRVARVLAACDAGGTLTDAVHHAERLSGPEAQLIHEAVAEVGASRGGVSTGLKERVEARLRQVEIDAARRMMSGTGIVATVGAVAPFVGLFGTVWGIVNSFVGISQAHTTNLAVVAPGIAEALQATAIGLVAAIPAVVIYNTLTRAITGYRHGLADASSRVLCQVSRDLDRGLLLRPHAAA